MTTAMVNIRKTIAAKSRSRSEEGHHFLKLDTRHIDVTRGGHGGKKI
jgi:hypothetical protein